MKPKEDAICHVGYRGAYVRHYPPSSTLSTAIHNTEKDRVKLELGRVVISDRSQMGLCLVGWLPCCGGFCSPGQKDPLNIPDLHSH